MRLCICCVLSAPCGGAQYAKVIQRLNFPATFKDFKVQNIVGSTDVRFPIRLEGLSYSHGLFCSVCGPALSLCEFCTGPAPAKAEGQLCATLLRVLLTRLARTFWPLGSSPCLAVSGVLCVRALACRALCSRARGFLPAPFAAVHRDSYRACALSPHSLIACCAVRAGAVPGADISHEGAEGGAADLCQRQGGADWCAAHPAESQGRPLTGVV